MKKFKTQFNNLLKGNFGFNINETMIGTHQFESNQGPKGDFPFSFTVNWGPKNIKIWINPRHDQFLSNNLEGTITIGEFGKNIPIKGSLVLKYFDEQKIRYTFEFNHQNKKYLFQGEKVNIHPFNLPTSHTTCFGTLIEKKSGKLISRSITHFRLRDSLKFLKSFRLEI